MAHDLLVRKGFKSSLRDNRPYLFRQGCFVYCLLLFCVIYCLYYFYYFFGFVPTFLFLAFNINYVISDSYDDWLRDISIRVDRHHPDCPSGGFMPVLTNIPEAVKHRHHEFEEKKEVLEKVFHVKRLPTRNDAVNPDGSLFIDKLQEMKDMVLKTKWFKHFHDRDKHVHRHLDMDHIRIEFYDYLKLRFLLTLNVNCYALEGIVQHYLHKLLLAVGITCFQRKVNYDHQLVEMMLETSLTVYFTKFLDHEGLGYHDQHDQHQNEDEKYQSSNNHHETDDPHSKIAMFEIHNPIFMYEDDSKVHTLLRITIDVHHRQFIDATLDGKSLSSKDASLLVSFIAAFSHHVKLHAYANWGIDPQHDHPMIRWLSAVSVTFNRYGYTDFPRLATFLRSIGYFAPGTAGFTAMMDHGLQQGLHYHAHIIELVNYSDFVRFIVANRGHFLNEFREVRTTLFPNVFGEAYFIATTVHSVDHTQFLRIWSDSSWAACDNHDYHVMKMMVSLVMCMFSGDLPMISFKYRFKDIKIAFFQNVYRHAYAIDPYMADHMDAAIIK